MALRKTFRRRAPDAARAGEGAALIPKSRVHMPAAGSHVGAGMNFRARCGFRGVAFGADGGAVYVPHLAATPNANLSAGYRWCVDCGLDWALEPQFAAA